MKKFKSFVRSFYKNVILKRKFKAFAYLLFDSEYRTQLNRLYELTKDCTKTELRRIPVNKLRYGHKIIYRDYQNSLIDKKTPPLRVVEDNNSFVIVDGNHRFLSKFFESHSGLGGDGTIECEVLL